MNFTGGNFTQQPTQRLPVKVSKTKRYVIAEDLERIGEYTERQAGQSALLGKVKDKIQETFLSLGRMQSVMSYFFSWKEGDFLNQPAIH